MSGIDEKRLADFKIRYHTSGHGESAPHLIDEGSYYDEAGLREILRLARLGLWAKEKGIPQLRIADKNHDDSGLGACPRAWDKTEQCNCAASGAAEALAALKAVGWKEGD